VEGKDNDGGYGICIQEASVSPQITGWKEHPEFSMSLCRSPLLISFGPKS
jgi:hypothetical protein